MLRRPVLVHGERGILAESLHFTVGIGGVLLLLELLFWCGVAWFAARKIRRLKDD